MSVTGARVVAIFALFGLTMVAGLGPVLVFNLWKKKKENNQQDGTNNSNSTANKILQLLLVFGGGVLLATCFVHMIPEIQENYDHYMETRESTHNHDEHEHEHEHDHDHNELIANTSTSLMERSEIIVNTSNSRDNIYKHPIHHDGEDEHSHGSVPWVEICICLGLFLTYFIEESVLLLIGRDSAHHHHHNHHNHIDHQHNSSGENGDHHGGKVGCDNIAIDLKGDDITVISSFHQQSNGHHHEPTSGHVEGVWTRFLRGLIIVVAFLAHSIFDGIAIGLQSTATSVWTMFFAICLHKLVVVFAIGFELFEKTRSLILTSIHMTIFAAMSPLGIFLSIVIEQGLSEDGSLPLILLNAVATGGILYIVFLEILQADRCPEINGLIQLVALMSGFILMTLITVSWSWS
ncbi:zinc transporter ZIP1-like [Panonychus citri]|uniref:zinc transporter ZIP1-like n=1 Tax=Panonychus citri TaxID=50023 RepID=UPI002307D34E|nr:zinc transporter ZIP1-like [Panonychus citri]